MSDQPRRRWFQFHLSTILLSTLVLAVFMGLNLRPTRFGDDDAYHARKYGWPLTVCIIENVKARVGYESETHFPTNRDALVIDIEVLLIALCLVAGLNEWRIRRKRR